MEYFFYQPVVRGSFFLVEPSNLVGQIQMSIIIEILWVEAANLLFCSAYFMLLLFWYSISISSKNRSVNRAEFYRGVSGRHIHLAMNNLKIPLIIIYGIAAVAYGTLITLCIMWKQYTDYLSYLVSVCSFLKTDWRFQDAVFAAILSLVEILIACGFLFYGIKLYKQSDLWSFLITSVISFLGVTGALAYENKCRRER